MIIMAAGALLGGIDRILGNRMGLGDKFEEGFRLLGPVALAQAGIICIAPVLANVLGPAVSTVYHALGQDPAMFGSILAMSSADVILSVSLSTVVLVLFALFCNRIFAVTFDEPFARATGTPAGLYNMLIAILTAVTIVIGMRMMGTMLISSLIIFPALTSMRVFSRFRHVLISSAVISVVCFVIGIMLSCLYSIPAGAGIVLVNLCAFMIFSLVGRIRS